MKKQKSATRTVVILICSVITLAAIAGGYWWYRQQTTPTQSNNSSDAALQHEGKTKKEEVVGNAEPTPTDSTSKDTTGQTYTPPQDTSNIVITPSQDGSQVTVTTKLLGYSDGTCNLTATNGAKLATQTAAVMFQREYSTCAGFTVPVSQLGTGTWNITLSVTSGGSTQTKSTSIGVK